MAPSKDAVWDWAASLANTAKANPALNNAIDSIRTKGPEAFAAAKNDPTLNNAIHAIRTKTPEALAAARNDPTLNHALETVRTKSSEILAAAQNDPRMYNALDTLRTQGADVLAAAKKDPTITNALATLRTKTPEYLAAVKHSPQFQQAVRAIRTHGPEALAYLQRPDVQKVIIAGGLVAGGTALIVQLAGFGLVGIAAGSPAAAFQSVAYGGLTPGGSAFSGLTAMGMRGQMGPLLLGSAIGAGILAAVGTAAFELEKSKL